jgi:uncharacterized protein YbjT (DUF2867 family)
MFINTRLCGFRRTPGGTTRPHLKRRQWCIAAAAVLANPEPHIGKVYELTGPQSLTMAQFAQELSGALGRTIQYVNVPPQIWEAKLQEAQLPAHLIAHLITMGQLHRDNRTTA